ncbi:MAG TPA: DUF6807 family protein [Phycisphaerae bacterium]|nr:DUF6807 family protein [Phycisphaerae bacterium]
MRKTIVSVVVAAACLAAFGAAGAAGEIQLKVTPQADGANVPVSAAVTLPADLAGAQPDQITVAMKSATGQSVPGQVVQCPACGTKVCWIAPALKAGQAQTWTATLTKGRYAGKDAYTFQDTAGKHLDLLCGGKLVTRYMYERDTSDKTRNFDTGKVYTHAFNELGSDTITKGTGGQYPHHRGIFLGYKVTYDGKKSGDWWHVRNVAQEHQKTLRTAAGPVLAASTVLIHWNDGAGKTVVAEERTTIVYRQPDPTLLLLDFRSKLTPVASDVVFGGDPEHAGMQFRPHNDVNRKTMQYLFPDEAITTKNVLKHDDLPWAAECYELKGKKYSVEHMNHPDNPKGTKYSAYRDYGRFGAYGKTEAKKDEPLLLSYRIWAATGEMPPRQELDQRSKAFATPPKVEVVK